MLKLLLGKFRTGIAQDQFHFSLAFVQGYPYPSLGRSILADLYIGAFANLPRLLDDLLQVMPFVAEQAEKGS